MTLKVILQAILANILYFYAKITPNNYKILILFVFYNLDMVGVASSNLVMPTTYKPCNRNDCRVFVCLGRLGG